MEGIKIARTFGVKFTLPSNQKIPMSKSGPYLLVVLFCCCVTGHLKNSCHYPRLTGLYLGVGGLVTTVVRLLIYSVLKRVNSCFVVTASTFTHVFKVK